MLVAAINFVPHLDFAILQLDWQKNNHNEKCITELEQSHILWTSLLVISLSPSTIKNIFTKNLHNKDRYG